MVGLSYVGWRLMECSFVRGQLIYESLMNENTWLDYEAMTAMPISIYLYPI